MKKYLNNLKLVDIKKNIVGDFLDKNNKIFKHAVFYNTHSYIESLKDSVFMKAILSSNQVFADGVGFYLATKIFNKKNIARVTGYDFFEAILDSINNHDKEVKIFFVGGEIENLNRLKFLILERYNNITSKNIEILAPPFGKDFKYIDDDTINTINSFEPDIIFVGLGAPKQEKWVYLNKKHLNCNNYLSIGAAFNFFTGLEIRAPVSFRKYGFEWLFRLILNPKKIYKRVFISGSIFIYLIFSSLLLRKDYYKLNPLSLNVKLINNFESFEWDKGYILSALNLASLSFLYKGDILLSKRIFFWGDGIFHKFMIKNSKKVAGRELISIIKYPNEIKKLHVVGNLTLQTKIYLEKKFLNLKIVNSHLPYGDIKSICKKLPLISENELVFLTLPTPKQEQVAEFYHKHNIKYKIVCIGGGLAIAAGDEKEVPKLFDYLGLEWLWRLRYETFRRLRRLCISALYMAKYILYGHYIKKIIVKFI